MANRICLTCGNSYEYCTSCPTSLNLPVWKNIFDTENCKNVFETVSDYAQKAITKDVAKEKLYKCDISNKYKDNIQKYLDDIMVETNKEVVVEWGVDSDIIAGLIFNIDEMIIDNSIRHKLEDLSKEIIKG